MKRILITCGLLFMVILGRSQCSASFSDTVYTQDSIAFINTSDTGSDFTYYWSFPGGLPNADTTTWIGEVPIVQYATGTYSACLIVEDNNTSCTDTLCQTIVVNPPGLNPSGTNTTCGACNGSASAGAFGGSPPYDYLWSTLQTTSSIANLCPGIYYVTLTDTFGNTASDSVIIGGSGTAINLNITLSDSTPCSGALITLEANVSGGTAPYNYDWFDGSNSTQTFLNTTATVSVTVTDDNSCTESDTVEVIFSSFSSLNITKTDETCAGCCDGSAAVSDTNGVYTYQWSTGDNNDSIFNLCPGNYSVTITDDVGCDTSASIDIAPYDSGLCETVEVALNSVFEGRLYLIEENSGVLSPVDSMDIDSSGSYQFNAVCPGTYYLKGALLPFHALYGDYVPTYYNESALWSNATAIIMTGSPILIDMALMPVTGTSGPGFIGGVISQTGGAPVHNATVVLYDDANEVISFVTSDAAGAYMFNDLPLGSYRVHVDILNKTSYPHFVTLKSEEPGSVNRNFVVTADVINPIPPLGVAAWPGSGTIRIYPNPVGAKACIETNGMSARFCSIYNLIGECVIQQPLNGYVDRFELDLGTLAPGPYLVRITCEQAVFTQRILKQ